jgi:hypothetical protein
MVTTSPGDPTHFSYQELEHARTDPLWRVSEVVGLIPWLEAARVEEQQRALPPFMFERLYLGRWSESDDRLSTLDDLRQCVQLDGSLPPVFHCDYVIGVDIGIKHDRTAVAVCHADIVDDATETGVRGVRVVVDRLERWRGTPAEPVRLRDVEVMVAELARAYRAQVLCDPWQAIEMMQTLNEQGVHVLEHTFTADSHARIATSLYNLIRSHNLWIPDDPDLLEELARIRLKESLPGMLRVDHEPGRHDDQAIAIGMAASWLIEKRPWIGPRIRILG